MKFLHLRTGGEPFGITFEFKWKQPATKGSSANNFIMLNRFWSLSKNPFPSHFLSIFPKMYYEKFLFPKIYWQNLAKHFFKGLTTDSMVFFSKHSSTTAILTEASVINLQMEFLDIFLYWFYIFNLHNFIFQRLIWKMISVYFLWFDYWTLKEWKTAKVQNHSVAVC